MASTRAVPDGRFTLPKSIRLLLEVSVARYPAGACTFQLSEGQHVGVSPIVTADTAGDYKYGIRLEDLDEEKVLGDEDPFLIVT
jgi:hypothetical protein